MKKAQNYLLAASTMLASAALPSCHKPTSCCDLPEYGTWTTGAAMTGPARESAVSFTIADTAFIGLGNDGTKQYADFWGYIPSNNTWFQLAGFPGTARSAAVAFAIGARGFVGTGYDGANLHNDFWRWNQATNTWDSVAPFPGSARRGAVAFSIGSFGYVTTGYDGTYQKDFWQYYPTVGPLGAWGQQTSFGGEKRSGAVAFVYGTKGYIVTGTDNGTECGDFWYYDATQGQWAQLRNIYNSNTQETYDANYTDIMRDNAVGFVINDSAYITTGENGGLLQSTWGYNFAEDQWVPKTPFSGTARQGASGFALNGYGYVTGGQNNSSYFKDLLRFSPN